VGESGLRRLFGDASFDERGAVSLFGRPRSNAASHAFGEIVVVLPAVQSDGLLVLPPLDGTKQFLHISDRSKCDANRPRLDSSALGALRRVLGLSSCSKSPPPQRKTGNLRKNLLNPLN